MNRALQVTIGFLIFGLTALSVSAGLKNSDCLDCHGDNTLFKTNSAGKADLAVRGRGQVEIVRPRAPTPASVATRTSPPNIPTTTDRSRR